MSTYWLSTRPDLALDRSSPTWKIEGPRFLLMLPDLGPAEQALVGTLFDTGGLETDLANAAVMTSGFEWLPRIYLLLGAMDNHGAICRSIRDGDTCLATLVPIGSRYRHVPAAPSETARYRLSRFAYCHVTDDGMLMESPLSQAKLVVRHRLASALLHELGTAPRSIDELSAAVPEASRCSAAAFVELAVSGGFVETHDETTEPESAADSAAGWEFHDLLFHSRSRLGRHRNPFGATYRFGDDMPAPPALKRPMSDHTVALETPDLSAIAGREASLTTVLESRRSIRSFGEAPISKSQLGEFLHRTFRLKRLIPTDHGELASRPYPSGGALYELEIYPVVDRCLELAPGMYHYRPGDHVLSRLPAQDDAVKALLEQAWLTLNREGRPQVLLIIAARFLRMTWKYQSVAYSLILKDVGVLFQTMYLVATAMNIAPCAMGGGDSELFASASGLNYLVEGSVGEFALGSKPC